MLPIDSEFYGGATWTGCKAIGTVGITEEDTRRERDTSYVNDKKKTELRRTEEPSTIYLLPVPLSHFLVLASMYHDFVGVARSHSRMSFRPIVGNGVGKQVAVPVESSRGDGARASLESYCDCVSDAANNGVSRGCTYSLAGFERPYPRSGWYHPSLHKQQLDNRSCMNEPLLPHVENVPCTGWKEISFTANTKAWSLELGTESRR